MTRLPNSSNSGRPATAAQEAAARARREATRRDAAAPAAAKAEHTEKRAAVAAHRDGFERRAPGTSQVRQEIARSAQHVAQSPATDAAKATALAQLARVDQRLARNELTPAIALRQTNLWVQHADGSAREVVAERATRATEVEQMNALQRGWAGLQGMGTVALETGRAAVGLARTLHELSPAGMATDIVRDTVVRGVRTGDPGAAFRGAVIEQQRDTNVALESTASTLRAVGEVAWNLSTPGIVMNGVEQTKRTIADLQSLAARGRLDVAGFGDVVRKHAAENATTRTAYGVLDGVTHIPTAISTGDPFDIGKAVAATGALFIGTQKPSVAGVPPRLPGGTVAVEVPHAGGFREVMRVRNGAERVPNAVLPAVDEARALRGVAAQDFPPLEGFADDVRQAALARVQSADEFRRLSGAYASAEDLPQVVLSAEQAGLSTRAAAEALSQSPEALRRLVNETIVGAESLHHLDTLWPGALQTVGTGAQRDRQVTGFACAYTSYEKVARALVAPTQAEDAVVRLMRGNAERVAQGRGISVAGMADSFNETLGPQTGLTATPRHLVNPSKDTLSQLARTAETSGRPVMLGIETPDEGGHAILLLGEKNGRFVIDDPATPGLTHVSPDVLRSRVRSYLDLAP